MDHRDMRAETGGMMTGMGSLYKEECLTRLTPVRVALRVPKRHGLFSVFPKNLEITKRTQLKNAHVFRREIVMQKIELGSFCKKSLKMEKKTPKYRSGRVILTAYEAKTNPIG
jgi:hypothetical protein